MGQRLKYHFNYCLSVFLFNLFSKSHLFPPHFYLSFRFTNYLYGIFFSLPSLVALLQIFLGLLIITTPWMSASLATNSLFWSTFLHRVSALRCQDPLERKDTVGWERSLPSRMTGTERLITWETLQVITHLVDGGMYFQGVFFILKPCLDT